MKIILAFLLVFFPLTTQAFQGASLGIVAKDKTAAKSEYMVVVNVETDMAVNAVGFNLEFDPQLLQVIDVDFSHSFCELFVEREILPDRVNIACGKPNPGVSTESEVVRIRFQTLKAGNGWLRFIRPQVLANDGLGTDVLSLVNDAAFSIIDAEDSVWTKAPEEDLPSASVPAHGRILLGPNRTV